MKVISISAMKGGVGKTTAAIEIGTIMKDLGHKALVIDLDPQCSLSNNIDLGNQDNITDTSNMNDTSNTNNMNNANNIRYTIYDVLRAKCNIRDAIIPHRLFDVIPGDKDIDLMGMLFNKDPDIIQSLRFVLEFIPEYDYVIIDNVPLIGSVLTMSYIAADYIIIPTLPDRDSLDKAYTTENSVLSLTGQGMSHAKVLCYILNGYDKSTALSKLALQELSDKNTYTISRSVLLSTVKTLKTSVYDYKKGSKQAKEYLYIVKDIMGKMEG